MYLSFGYLKELDGYHSKIIVTNRLAQKAPNISTSSWLKPLKNVVYKQPQIAHAIIQQLLGSGAEFASNNAFFQQLYLDMIKEYLTRLGALEESMKRNTDLNNADESELYIFGQHQLCCEAIHQLLIAWNPPLDTMELEVDELLMNLLHRVKNNPSEHLSKGSVYSALLVHSPDNLLQKFCSIENDWQLGLCSGSSLEQASSLARSFVPSEALLTCSCEKDRPNAWKLFYFHARNNHHILEEVVVSFLDHILSHLTPILFPLIDFLIPLLLILFSYFLISSLTNLFSVLLHSFILPSFPFPHLFHSPTFSTSTCSFLSDCLTIHFIMFLFRKAVWSLFDKETLTKLPRSCLVLSFLQ